MRNVAAAGLMGFPLVFFVAVLMQLLPDDVTEGLITPRIAKNPSIDKHFGASARCINGIDH